LAAHLEGNVELAVERGVLNDAGMNPPSPTQHHPPSVSAQPTSYDEPLDAHPTSSPRMTPLQNGIQNKLRQLEQLQYYLTKQVYKLVASYTTKMYFTLTLVCIRDLCLN